MNKASKQLFISLVCLFLFVLSCGDGGKDVSNSGDCIYQTEVCDGLDNNCNDQVDERADADCDDGVSCTIDSCRDGQCRHLANHSICDDNLYCNGKESCDSALDCQSGEIVDCSDLNVQCQRGFCNEDTDSCDSENFTSGTPCDDGLWCTEGEMCLAGGLCGSGTPRDCSAVAVGQCEFGNCDEESDSCEVQFVSEGAGCDDGLWCTALDICDGFGSCLGQPRDCSAVDDQCNEGLCDEDEDICYASDVNEGQSCDDGVFCNVGEVCELGVCGAGIPRDCDDSLFCTGMETCNELTASCDSSGDPCPPGNDCNICQEDSDSCFDPAGAACGDSSSSLCDRPDTCDGSGSCLPRWEADDTACEDDGDICTVDVCQDGECSHSLTANDCGSYECGWSPSECHNCGRCSMGQACRNHQCVNLHMWSKVFGGESFDGAWDMAIDSQEQLYLVGEFRSDEIQFNEDILINPSFSSESYIAKLSGAQGQVIWTKNFAAGISDDARVVAVDNSDNIFVAGTFDETGQIDLGAGPLAVETDPYFRGGNEIYFGRFTPNGDHLWSSSIYSVLTNPGHESPEDIAVGSNGLVYLLSRYASERIGGCIDGIIDSPPDLFLIISSENKASTDYCLSPWDYWVCSNCFAGGVLFELFIKGDNREEVHDIALDNENNVYIAGNFKSSNLRTFNNGSAQYGGSEPLATRGGNDIFLAKASSQAELIWIEQFGGSGEENVSAVAVDEEDNIYLAGQLNVNSELDFGEGPLSYVGGNGDVYVVKLNSERQHLWSRVLGGSGNESIGVGEMALSRDGGIYITGLFDSTDFDLGNGPLRNAGNDDVFLVKLNQGDGSLIWDTSFGGDNRDQPRALVVGEGGVLFLAGNSFSQELNLGGETFYNNGNFDIFVVGLQDQ